MQNSKTRGRIIEDELHRGREDQGGCTTESTCMSKRVGKDEMERSPLWACSCWFAWLVIVVPTTAFSGGITSAIRGFYCFCSVVSRRFAPFELGPPLCSYLSSSKHTFRQLRYSYSTTVPLFYVDCFQSTLYLYTEGLPLPPFFLLNGFGYFYSKNSEFNGTSGWSAK